VPDIPLPDLTFPNLGMTEGLWPLVVLGLRIAVAGALYIFLIGAFRALRTELRTESAPAVAAPATEAPIETRVETREVAERDIRTWLEIVRCDGAADLAGRRYPLEDVTLIGRSSDNTVVLPDRRVSARHARLAPRNGDWWIEDLGSTNGTFVGTRQVATMARLDPSSEIRFGPVVARMTREAARR
jgi:hypothetical protein